MKNPALRANELRRIFADRYGGVFPDDDAGREDLILLLGQLAQLSKAPFAMDNLLGASAPWAGADDREALKQEATTGFIWWSADDLGRKIGLTMDTRMRLGVRTIGAVDCDEQARLDRRKALAAERERKRRRHGNKKLKRRPKLTDRSFAVLEALPPHSWHSVSWLVDELEDHRAFADKHARKPAEVSMRRLVKRAIENLVKEGLAYTDTRPGYRGFPTTFVTRDEHCARQTVLGDSKGTKTHAQC
jgi:hypothetical protein